MHMLPITLTIAAAAALLSIWLGYRIGRIRHRTGISIGDGGNPALTARMRAQANFTENTPIFLILLAAVELARGQETWLWIVAILFILGRIVHALGMDRPPPSPLRTIGIGINYATMIGLAVFAVTIPYFTAAPVSSIGIAAAR